MTLQEAAKAVIAEDNEYVRALPRETPDNSQEWLHPDDRKLGAVLGLVEEVGEQANRIVAALFSNLSFLDPAMVTGAMLETLQLGVRIGYRAAGMEVPEPVAPEEGEQAA